MSSSKAIAVGLLILGVVSFVGGQYGVNYCRDQADKRADDYITHLSTYQGGDWLHARDGYIEQTRVQQIGFYVVHFGGLIVACWAASMLRRKRETL